MITSSLREVNSVNYKECFAILKESAVFDFRSFQLTSSMVNLSVSSLLRNQQLCKHNLAHNYVFIVLFVFLDCTIDIIDDLPVLLEDLHEVAPSWRIVGLHLNILYDHLDIIQTDNRMCVNCLTAMLYSWLKGMGTPATPAVLVQALNKTGRTDIAKRIAARYGENQINVCMSAK